MYLFRNKCHIESARLKDWGCLSVGAYFITICTKDRLRHFGEIAKNGEIQLNEIGKIADKFYR